MTEVLQRTLPFFALGHWYLFLRWYLAFGRRPLFLFTLPWFVCMGIFPLLHAALPADGFAQQALAFAGQLWQPFAFFCIAVFAGFDALSIIAWCFRRIFPACGFTPRLSSRPALGLIFLFACVFGYGLYEARSLQTIRLEIAVPGLPEGTNRLRLVFAADFHIGPQTGRNMLRHTVDTILSERPDCILLGGDMFDDAMRGTPGDVTELRRLSAPLGVYGVLGNHDAFGDWRRPQTMLREAGIHMLADEAVAVGPLRILGLDDPKAREHKNTAAPDVAVLAEQTAPASFTVLLEHRPRLRPESLGLLDLQLSGHTHGGQLFFLEPLMRSSYGIPTGESTYGSPEKETRVIVTTGVGFSKLPIRLLTPPEIVVVDLVRRRP